MTTQALAPDDLTLALKRAIRDVPDFPKPGVVFKDITPVLADPRLFGPVVEAMATPWREQGITHVVGIESRGFILGAPVALALRAGFVPIRKPGKLPFTTRFEEYALEYGTDRLEVHVDACESGARVLIVDDVLATGGTAAAACRLVEAVGGTVAGLSFLLALSFLRGEEAIMGRRAETLLVF
ncbi:MAG: adenine phosphoribosyltransferase [Gemmatimonadaceae bacterium]